MAISFEREDEYKRKEESSFVHTHDEVRTINFHDCDIQVGYHITRIVAPYVVNRVEVEKDPTIKIIVRSKSGQKAVTFTKELPKTEQKEIDI